MKVLKALNNWSWELVQMTNIFIAIVSTLVTLPLLGLFIIYIITLKVTQNKKWSFHFSIDSSTLIFILSVNVMIYVIFKQSYLWAIILTLLLIGSGLVLLQWRLFKEVSIRKFLKSFLRVNFILFFLSYIFFMCYGIINRLSAL